MTHRLLAFALALVMSAAAAVSQDAGTVTKKKDHRRPTRTTEAMNNDKAPAAEPPVEMGSKDSKIWSATTTEAAATPEQKAWLKKGTPGSVTGEVVDISCYAQLGKTGPKHMDCGGKCARNGQPVGLLTKSKEVYLVIPEEHHPRRDGQATLKEQLATNMGKQVKATGMIQRSPQGKTIFVSAMQAQ